MGMNTYPLQLQAAFVVDAELSAYIQLAYDQKEGRVPNEIQKLFDEGKFGELAKAGKLPEGEDGTDYLDMNMTHECAESLNIGVCHCTEFDGQASLVFPDRCQPGAQEDLKFEDDFLLYIPYAREMSLFKAAYESPEELLEEFKKHFADVDLPADFDWWARVRSLDGTYYC